MDIIHIIQIQYQIQKLDKDSYGILKLVNSDKVQMFA